MGNILTTISLMCVVASFLVTEQFHGGALVGAALGLSLGSYLMMVAERIEKQKQERTVTIGNTTIVFRGQK
jgi:hypothetical protein